MHRRLVGWWLLVAGCGRTAAVPPLAPVTSAHLVRGRRVGLVTNQTGVDAHGVGDAERLRASGVDLRALFSPEHGFRGVADPGAAVASVRDSATGLPIYSLYGRTVAPTDTMLAGLDVLLIDLQDVGARYYTYLATTMEVMRSAARRGVPVIVLDRPDPLGGAVQGNVLDPAYASFVGRLAVPMRHGLTLGELARLANADEALGADLHVVPVAGWRRSLRDGGLPWIPPSPNLQTLEAVAHYPGTCLFEGTNLSVGRGSAAPFEQVGAPWLDAGAVLASLDRSARLGVDFEPVHFTPRAPGDAKFADTLVHGIRLHVTDGAAYDPTRTAIALLAAVRQVHPDRFRWLAAHFDRLAGSPALREALEAGTSPAELSAGWDAQRAAYLLRRAGFLLYPD